MKRRQLQQQQQQRMEAHYADILSQRPPGFTR